MTRITVNVRVQSDIQELVAEIRELQAVSRTPIVLTVAYIPYGNEVAPLPRQRPLKDVVAAALSKADLAYGRQHYTSPQIGVGRPHPSRVAAIEGLFRQREDALKEAFRSLRQSRFPHSRAEYLAANYEQLEARFSISKSPLKDQLIKAIAKHTFES